MTTNLTPLSPTEISEQLAQALRNYHQSSQDLGDYRAKAARAQADQEAALASDGTEDEIAAKIAKSEAMKQVYSVRTKFKETELERRTSEVEKLYPSAVIEFTSLINGELDKRRAIVTERILQAVDLDENLTMNETLALPQYTGALVECAKSVRSIASLRPATYWGTRGDGAAIAAAASALLDNLKQFNELTS